MASEFNPASWLALGITQKTIDLLEPEGFLIPTPVQEQSIPETLKGKDLVVSAKTGSGKTAGFCFPMIEKIRGRSGTLGLIICPVREIALQTHKVLEQFAKPQGISSLVMIGGASARLEKKGLSEYPNILVGTPGRIFDHLEQGNLWINYVEIVVLDEADRMLDMGFSKHLDQIIQEISPKRQTLLFSATIVGETEKLAKKILKKPQRISFGSSIKVSESIFQELLWVNRRSKIRELSRILKEEKGSTLIFTASKSRAYDVWRAVYTDGFINSDYLSSDKKQSQREKTLKDFQDGTIRILIATDVAGRGIHVEDVKHVINFDFPKETEDYIHRVGRTGRQDKKGKATSFVTPEEINDLEHIEKHLGITIPENYAKDYSLKRTIARKNPFHKKPNRYKKKSKF